MNKIKGSFFAFSATTIFAINFVSMKVLVSKIPSMLLVGLRFLIAGIFLFILCKLLRLNLKVKNKNDMKEFIITGFFGMSFYYIFFTYALKYISAPLSSLLCSMIPIITIFFYAVYSKTKIDLTVTIAFLISIIGVYLAIDLNSLTNNLTNLLIGILLMLVAVLGWIYYTIRVESIFNKYNSLVMLMYQSLAGGIINCLLSIYQYDDVILFFNSKITFNIIGNLLFVGIFGSAIGYYFFNLGIKHLGVTISSGYNNVMPGITLITSHFLIGTPITMRKTIGICIVIGITFFVTFKDKLKAKNKKRLKKAS